THTSDLLANASEEDIKALFSGFDSLRFDEESISLGGDSFAGDFGHFSSYEPTGVQGWNNVNGGFESEPQLSIQLPNTLETLNMRHISATVDHLCTRDSSHPSATNFPPHPPLQPLRRIPTPAPWVSVPEPHIPAPGPFVTGTPLL
ncbi:hypothetical protein FRC07_014675, partial [Ceratobasidium sp. 392]